MDSSSPESTHCELIQHIVTAKKMDKKYLIAGIGFLAAMAASKKAKAPGISYLDKPGAPRGIRNNNPGNLRASGANWRGAIGQDQDGFVRFKDYAHGVRAAIKVLQTYYNRHNIRTWQGVADRWAPASDGNNPAQYAAFLAHSTGSSTFNLSPDTLFKAIRAIVTIENGNQYAYTITPDIFRRALQMT